jgi:hypothetical protein
VRGTLVAPHDFGQGERKSGALYRRWYGTRVDRSRGLRWLRSRPAGHEENNNTPPQREGCKKQGETESTLEHRLAASHAQCHAEFRAVRITGFPVAGPAGSITKSPLEESSSSAYCGGR